MMQAHNVAFYDNRVDHDADFHAEQSLLPHQHHGQWQQAPPPEASASTGAATTSGGLLGASGRGPRWRQLEVRTYARLAFIEFVATYLFAVGTGTVTVGSAMARDRSADTELTGSRVLTVVLCGALAYAVLHWGFNLYAQDQQRQSPPHLVDRARGTRGPGSPGDGGERGGAGRGDAHVEHAAPLTAILGKAPVAHMNPVVTLALLVATEMHYVLAVVLLPVQLLAAVLAATTVWVVTPAEFARHVAGVVPSAESSWWQDFLCEFFMTMFAFAGLVAYAATRGLAGSDATRLLQQGNPPGHKWSVDDDADATGDGMGKRPILASEAGSAAAAADGGGDGDEGGDWMIVEDEQGEMIGHDAAAARRGPRDAAALRLEQERAAHYEAKIVRGLTSSAQLSLPVAALFAPLFVAGLVVTSVSGGSLNPALSFGVSLVTNTWKLHWLRWAAPVLGAVALGFLLEGLSSVCGRKRKLRRNHNSNRRSAAAGTVEEGRDTFTGGGGGRGSGGGGVWDESKAD